MRFSVRPTVADISESFESSWEDLVEWFGQHAQGMTHSVKEDNDLWAPANFHRGLYNRDVVEIDAWVGDYDGVPVAEMRRVLGLAKAFRGCAYTSYSHGTPAKGETCFRIVLPFDRACSAKDYARLWSTMHAQFKSSRKERNIGRWWYLPTTNPASPHKCWFKSWDGPLLGVDALLSAPAVVELVDEIELAQSEKISTADIGKLSMKLVRSSNAHQQSVGRALQKMIMGEPFAPDHERNDAAFKVAGEVMKAFPLANLDSIVKLCHHSLTVEGNTTPEQFRSMLERQGRAKAVELRERERFANALNPHRAVPTPLQIDQPALVLDTVPLIVQRDGFYWVRKSDSPDFSDCYGAKDAHLGLMRTFAEFLCDGEGKPKKLEQILLDYSAVAKHVQATYLAQQNTFDPQTRILTLATAPRSRLEPTHHQDVAEWLHILGGDSYEHLIGWLRGLERLDFPAPALYLYGESGAGKSLFWTGCAGLWEALPNAFSNLVRGFQQGLEKSPIVVADEGLPPGVSLDFLREFLTRDSWHINIKFKPLLEFRGCPRLIIAANNFSVLPERKGAMTIDDVRAIAARFIPIRVGFQSRKFLEKIPGRTFERKMSEHVLWLIQNGGAVTPTGRFVIDGVGEGLARHIAGHRFGWFLDFVLDYLHNPLGLEITYTPSNPKAWRMLIRDGKLWICTDARELLPDWHEKIGSREMSQACQVFQAGPRERLSVPGHADHRRWYYAIDTGALAGAAGDSADVERIAHTMASDTEARIEARLNKGLRAVR
jgi:hypothetical protein